MSKTNLPSDVTLELDKQIWLDSGEDFLEQEIVRGHPYLFNDSQQELFRTLANNMTDCAFAFGGVTVASLLLSFALVCIPPRPRPARHIPLPSYRLPSKFLSTNTAVIVYD